MKFCIVFLIVVYLSELGYLAHIASPKCPSNEYNPGPNCGTEPTCAPPSSHFWPKHTCDCWCRPGLYRDVDTNECVKICAPPPGLPSRSRRQFTRKTYYKYNNRGRAVNRHS
ncbi:uncharacterized protein LOC134666971 [Cydia fagiglandana]|uniref:uncharacterized protein LOC134666971 n=1 Tax=Cydia fagiglandana TaxID=1458189 RepID=UPI002FEDF6D3